MSALSDKGITLEGLAAAVDALRQELATWKALAHKQDQLTADQITATQSGATAAKISQIAVNTAAIQSLAAQVAGQISLEYVTTLPATGEPLTLYLVPQGDGTAPNFCNEYLWVNNAWELIGTTGAMANNGELSIQVNGVTVGTFTANQAANAAVNITVPTNTNQLVNGAQFVDAAALQTALALKQNSLNTAQLEAVNSGITAAGVQQIADNATAIAGKQDKLSTAQQAAVDSGATAAKIDQIASNASAIVSLTSSKQDALSVTQLAAVNSGVTAAGVQQIGTNASNISSLQTAVSSKAADNSVVHLAGAETITGDKTFTGTNRFSLILYQKGFSPRASAPSSNEFGQFAVVGTDNSSVMSINYANRTTGARDFSFRVYDSTGSVNGAGVFKDASDNYSFCPLDPNKAISLGNSGNQWASVYAQTYYYKGTQWGLDKANTWTGNNSFTSNFVLQNTSWSGVIPPSSAKATVIEFKNSDTRQGRYINRIGVNSAETWIETIRNVDANTSHNFTVIYSVDNTGNKKLVPYNSDAGLGESISSGTGRWKTLNGINPGALSFPDISKKVNLDTTNWDISGGNNAYTPSADGFISIRSTTATQITIVENTTGFGTSVVSPTSATLIAFLPVAQGMSINIIVNCTSINQAVFLPAKGNV